MSDGLSIRMVRNYRPGDDKFVTALDMALVSCARLGHTWLINKGEPVCNICGAPNPETVHA